MARNALSVRHLIEVIGRECIKHGLKRLRRLVVGYSGTPGLTGGTNAPDSARVGWLIEAVSLGGDLVQGRRQLARLRRLKIKFGDVWPTMT